MSGSKSAVTLICDQLAKAASKKGIKIPPSPHSAYCVFSAYERKHNAALNNLRAPDQSPIISAKWWGLTAEQKQHWKNQFAQEKARYHEHLKQIQRENPDFQLEMLKTNIPKSHVKVVLDAFNAQVTKSLKNEEIIGLKKFGSFKIDKKSGEIMFTPSKSLKDAIFQLDCVGEDENEDEN